jgi:hypothetical protein
MSDGAHFDAGYSGAVHSLTVLYPADCCFPVHASSVLSLPLLAAQQQHLQRVCKYIATEVLRHLMKGGKPCAVISG